MNYQQDKHLKSFVKTKIRTGRDCPSWKSRQKTKPESLTSYTGSLIPREIVSVDNLLPAESPEAGLLLTSPPSPSSLLFSLAEFAKFLLLEAEHKNLAAIGKTRLPLFLLQMQVLRRDMWDDRKTRKLTKSENKSKETESREGGDGERERGWFWKTWKRENWEEEAICPKSHADGGRESFLWLPLAVRPRTRNAERWRDNAIRPNQIKPKSAADILSASQERRLQC